MAVLNMVEAIRAALTSEMERDERVMVLGQDVATLGGVFRATDGLATRFGPERVFDTPLAESSIIGASVGLAASGLVPASISVIASRIAPSRSPSRSFGSIRSS